MLGRFVSEDPIGITGGDNSYVYSRNNPLNAVAPSGLLTIPFVGWVDFGEGAGEEALQYYINVINDPNTSALGRGAAYVGAFFSALWTPCTSDKTFTTLSAAYGVGKWAGRPFWQ